MTPAEKERAAEVAKGLSAAQLHILLHSLGLTYGGGMYRNHFVTGEGSVDFPLCIQLTELGFMTRSKGSDLTGGDDVFFVTDAGKQVARNHLTEQDK